MSQPLMAAASSWWASLEGKGSLSLYHLMPLPPTSRHHHHRAQIQNKWRNTKTSSFQSSCQQASLRTLAQR